MKKNIEDEHYLISKNTNFNKTILFVSLFTLGILLLIILAITLPDSPDFDEPPSALSLYNGNALMIVDAQKCFKKSEFLSYNVDSADWNTVAFNIMNLINSVDWEVIIVSLETHSINDTSFSSSYTNKSFGDKVNIDGIYNQTLWPDHCLNNTAEREIISELQFVLQDNKTQVIEKKENFYEHYSSFFDEVYSLATDTNLKLLKNQIGSLYITGFSTVYNSGKTAVDGSRLGYKVYLVEDAIVDFNFGNTEDNQLAEDNFSFYNVTKLITRDVLLNLN